MLIHQELVELKIKFQSNIIFICFLSLAMKDVKA